jgi:hypothetical protein
MRVILTRWPHSGAGKDRDRPLSSIDHAAREIIEIARAYDSAAVLSYSPNSSVLHLQSGPLPADVIPRVRQISRSYGITTKVRDRLDTPADVEPAPET